MSPQINALDGVTEPSGPQPYEYANRAVPTPPFSGIASKVGELQKSVAELSDVVRGLQGALGLGTPQAEEQTSQPPNLFEALNEVVRRVNLASCDIREAVQHLNS